MKDRYYYIIAGLPFLEFGMRSPISYSDFLRSCEGQVSEKDLDSEKNTTFVEWKNFDRSLKNELVHVRAEKKGLDPLKFIKGEHYPDPGTGHMAHWAISQEALKETEFGLDRFRWEKLEELEKGHYFDIDYLIIYREKIKILERWDNINSNDGTGVLKELVDKESK